jgi:O-antigen ligase
MTRRREKTPKQKNANPPPAVSHDTPEDRLRPWLLAAMTALVVARVLFPSESAASQGDGLSMVMLWIAIGVFWLLGVVGRPLFALRFGWTDAAVLLLVIWTAVASLWAVQHGTPRPAVNMLWEWVGLGLCFFLARQFIVTPRERRAIVAVMIAVAVGVSVYGLYHAWWEMPQTRAMYKANPDAAMRQVGLWFPPGSPGRKLLEDRLDNTQPMATFALTNSLAAFLTPWLVMLIGVIGCSVRSRKRLLALAACLIPIAVCLLLTESRSGYIAVCVGALAIWLLGRGRQIRIGWKLPVALVTIAAVFLCAALAIKGTAVLGRASKSFGYRVQYWHSSLRMIADHPWLGCGPGNFQATYTQYKLPEASEEVADPHNFLLEICATAGTPAALAFLAVLACALRNAHDAWPHVLAGGVLGFLLSVPMGILCAAPLGPAPVLLGLPLAAASVALTLGWIREGTLPRWLPGVCVVALLINLLAAGGITYPGIAGSFWLLLALSLDDRGSRTWDIAAAWAALAVLLALSVACYFTAYRPVLACQAELRLVEQEPANAIKHLEAAAAADPLSSEPWNQLAALQIEAWRQQPERVDLARFWEARDKAMRLAPNSSARWLTAGDWAFQAYSTTDQHGKRLAPEAIQSAVESYSRAVQLYPNNALGRAKLAEACLAAGDRSAFRREAEMALRLDQITPHSDKKLPDQLRTRLRELLKTGT